MNCRSCNTRLSSPKGACPNCGRSERQSKFIDEAEMAPSPSDSGTSLSPLSPSSTSTSGSQDAVDLDLDEEVELPLEEAVAPTATKATKKAVKRSAKSSNKGTAPVASASSKNVSKATSRPVAKSTAKLAKPSPPASEAEPMSFMPIELEQIRHMISERPELLEPGFSGYVDDEGADAGAGFETEVGEIDLLARNADGELVVVMVVEGGAAAEAVTGVLLRMGWVSKHVPDAENAGVRGIVLLEDAGDDLGYTAAAVSDRIDFRTWRMQISFEALSTD
jgi:hypothetical protein